MADFTWLPDYGAALSKAPRIRSTQFGDGYEQRSADGINSNLGKWELKFSNRDLTEAQAIYDFLEGKGGLTAFTFDGPIVGTKTVVCSEWSLTPSAYGLYDVGATFKEVMG